jgi:hypothetical protein
MKNICGVDVIESIDDFLHDDDTANRFYEWQCQKANDFINEPERAARCHDAAADGCDGSYHWEVIDDFREFGSELLQESWGLIVHELEDQEQPATIWRGAEVGHDGCVEAFNKCCDDLEEWHRQNGTYEEQCG